jgi:radical SAM protein with 4Fe4S-binding SPASM domain
MKDQQPVKGCTEKVIDPGRTPWGSYHKMLSYVLCRRLEPGTFPKTVRIETINSCNNVCSFCPMNIHSEETKKRKVTLMEETLFKKIIDELAFVNFQGVMKLYCGNEPLLDKRLTHFVEYVKERLPGLKHIQIDTNGILLTEELGIKLLEAGISSMYINDYTKTGGNGVNYRNEPIKGIYESLRKRFPGTALTYSPRKVNEVLNNLGGQSPNNRLRLAHSIEAPCAYPFYAFVITSNGNVGLCCADLVFEEPLGNVNSGSISSIWQGEAFSQFRISLLEGKRIKKLCSNCTMYGHFDMREQTGERIPMYEFLSIPLAVRSKLGASIRWLRKIRSGDKNE